MLRMTFSGRFVLVLPGSISWRTGTETFGASEGSNAPTMNSRRFSWLGLRQVADVERANPAAGGIICKDDFDLCLQSKPKREPL